MKSEVQSESSNSLFSTCREMAVRAREASQQLALIDGQLIDQWLIQSAELLESSISEILAANQLDVDRQDEFGLTNAQVDRLKLDEARIRSIATGLRQVAALQSPIGATIESSVRPNGLEVKKVRVPLGVVFFIYESRPNVTADAAAICAKSRNAVILRGGKEAAHSSKLIVERMMQVATELNLPADIVQLVPTTDRAAVDHFLSMGDLIDLTIPRGGTSLIERVAANAKMPVIKHFSGNCHVYVDQSADLEVASQIVINSKCQRLGVCNAAESLLIHQSLVDTFLPEICQQLTEQGIEIRGDQSVCQKIPNAKPASDDDYRSEFLDAIISVAVVPDVQSAAEHINRFGSAHTDAIVATDVRAIGHFTSAVDTAAVMVNASTRFNDGSELGLGAEIGISTDKFHARGPCGLQELTTYKYVCTGNGHIR